MKKSYHEKSVGRKLFLQKKTDKGTCPGRSSSVKNPERMNGSEEKRCKGINVEGDQSQREQQAHCRCNLSPKECGISQPKRGQEAQQETEKKKAQRSTWQSKKNHVNLGQKHKSQQEHVTDVPKELKAQCSYRSLREDDTNVDFVRKTRWNMKKGICCF